MKYLFLIIISISLFCSCKNEKKSPPDIKTPEVKIDSTLITDSSWGIINSSSNFEKLQQLFGESNIKDERICGPECADSVDVTKVYPGKSGEIVVYWKDSAYHKKIDFLQTYQDKSPYHTAAGLKMGSTLNEVLKLNGQKINFSGFGWDYGGGIQSFNNGKLDKSAISFILDLTDYSDESLVGEIGLDTDMPQVKKALDKIVIYFLSLTFNKE